MTLLVDREMWDPRTLTVHAIAVGRKLGGSSAVVSHISRKTSEMWGTPAFVLGLDLAFL